MGTYTQSLTPRRFGRGVSLNAGPIREERHRSTALLNGNYPLIAREDTVKAEPLEKEQTEPNLQKLLEK